MRAEMHVRLKLLLSDFNKHLNVRRILQTSSEYIFMNVRSAVLEFLPTGGQAVRQTDMTKIIALKLRFVVSGV
jgi:hypothetical protein